MTVRYFDAHSHVHFEAFDQDRDATLARMKEAGVGTITVGCDQKTSREAVAFAEGNENVWATIGHHPGDNRAEEFDVAIYRAMARSPKVVVIGECGLDYYRIEVEKEVEEKKRQRAIFEQQIAFAKEVEKPLMIHCRDAHGDVIAYLRESFDAAQDKAPAIIHFFTGTIEEARQYLELGCYLSFSGVVTFASMYEELVRYVPLDRILTETDSPYAAPVPHRGKRNEPIFVIDTLRYIATLRGITEEEMRVLVLKNVEEVFKVKLS